MKTLHLLIHHNIITKQNITFTKKKNESRNTNIFRNKSDY
jgi:hypothetical protein